MTTTFHTIEVEGLNVFWRQAGHPETPKLLLRGFPSSSHQFRQRTGLVLASLSLPAGGAR